MAEEEFQERSSVKTETEKEQSVVEQETVKDPVIIESEDVTEETEPDYMQMEVKNPRIGKVLKLEEEAKRQNELEQLRSKRIRQQQEYINQMIDSVEANLKNTKEEQKLNEEFERHIRTEVYRMHGISEDKLQGMEERRNAWYQGAAFALFFLSLVLVAVCGILHGFDSELCIFMAFYTAIEGTLLSNGRKQAAFFEVLIRVLYLLLYPVMLTVFVCYELKFEEYHVLVPIFVIAGMVVLMLGAVSYFVYDPYRVDKRNRKKANSYIKEMEKAALKEVRLKEKAFGKLQRKNEKNAEKEKVRKEKEEQKLEKRKMRKEKLSAWWTGIRHKNKKAEQSDGENRTEEMPETKQSDEMQENMTEAKMQDEEPENMPETKTSDEVPKNMPKEKMQDEILADMSEDKKENI